MKTVCIFAIFAILGMPIANAESTVEIVMEKTTYSYCEKLFYTINVSNVTGNPAIVHIRDSTGKGSSAIPISITNHENPVPALIAFNENLFAPGDYFVDVEYEGQKTTAGFTIVDSGKKCLPELLKPIVANWIGGSISDGILLDAFERYADKEILEVSIQITGDNIDDVYIPSWVKDLAFWWIEGGIADEELAGSLEYLMENDIITIRVQNT
ncbi:MAG: hypothetical protein OXC46_01940 [Thaumarchaeota archaeon]|nr:hypothetical protein [Nitrososphaerota archaeon]